MVAELWHVQPNSSSSNMMTMLLTQHGVGLCIVGALYLRPCDYDDLYIYDEVYVCGSAFYPAELWGWSVCRFVTFYPSELSVRGTQEDVGENPKSTQEGPAL